MSLNTVISPFKEEFNNSTKTNANYNSPKQIEQKKKKKHRKILQN